MGDRSVVVRLRAEIADFKRGMAEASAAARRTAQETQSTSEQASSASERLGASLVDNASDWDKLANVAVVAGGSIAGALALSAKAAIEWETAWAGVNKTVDGTPAQMAELEGELRGLARELPATQTEIAGVAEAAGQLGIAREDILTFTRTMIGLGVSTNLSADEAATAIAQITNVMGTLKREGPEGVERFASTLVALGNAGASTESDIVQTAQRIAGAGKIIGASESDILAVANATASVGIEAQLAGGVMSRVMLQINSAVKSGGDGLDQFAKVAGVSATEFAKRWKSDPVAAIDLFIKGLGKVDAAGGDAAGTLDDLGLKGTENASVLLRLVGAGDLLSESLATGARAWQENTAAQDEAQKRYETTASQIQVAKNTINDAAIDFGSLLAPAIREAADATSALAGGMADLPTGVQGAIVSVAAGASGLALLAGGAIRATTAVIGFRASLDSATASGGAFAGRLKGIGAATALIGGTIVAGNALQEVWDGVAGANEDATRSLSNYLEAGKDAPNVSSLMAAGLEDLNTQVSLALDSGASAKIGEFFGELGTAGGLYGGTKRDDAGLFFRQIDDALNGFIKNGRGDEAKAIFERIAQAASAQGYTLEQVGQILPQTSSQLEQMAGSGDKAAAAVGNEGTAGALAQLTEANVQAESQTSAVSAAILALGGTADAASQQVQDLAKVIQNDMDSAGSAFAGAFDVLGKYDPNTGRDALERATKAVVDAEKRVQDVRARTAAKKKTTVADTQALESAEAAAAEARANRVKAANDVTAGSLTSMYKSAVTDARTFATDIQRVTAAGLDPAVVAKLLQAGPEQAAPVLEELLGAHSKQMIEMVNESEATLRTLNGVVVQEARLTSIAVNASSDEIAGHLDEATQIIAAKATAKGKITAEALAKQMKLPVELVKQIATEYGIALESVKEEVPAEVGTYVRVTGATEAKAEVDIFKTSTDAVPPDVTTRVSVLGAEAGARSVTTLDGFIDGLGGKTVRVATTGTLESIAQVRALQALIAQMDGRYVVTGRLPNGGLNTKGGQTANAADGGAVVGPGTGTSDSIPYMLSNGEHVLTAAEVDLAGGQAAVYRMRRDIRSGALRYSIGGAAGVGLSERAAALQTPVHGLTASIPGVQYATSSTTTTHRREFHQPVTIEQMVVADYNDFLVKADEEKRRSALGGPL